MTECIFCKIVAGEISAEIVFEDDQVVAFRDIKPAAPVHVLVVPRLHFDSLDQLPDDTETSGSLLPAIKKVAAKLGVSGGYQVLTNCGEAAGQVIPHLHFHILAGKKFVP